MQRKRLIRLKIQKANDNFQYLMLKELELSIEDHYQLIQYCNSKKIKFLSTAFDVDGLFLASLNLGILKIPSGELTNYPYLKAVAKDKS